MSAKFFAALIVCWVAAAPIATAQPAPADETLADLKCAFASIMLVQMAPDAELRAAATSAMHYYIGRIDGRAPDIDYATAIQANQRELENLDPQAELLRCSAHLMARGRALQDAGRVLLFNATVQKP
jgi:hypothetical protein